MKYKMQNIPRSKDTLQYAYLLANKRRNSKETVKYTLTIDAKLSTIVYTYNATIHLNSRMLDLYDCCNNIAKNSGGQNGEGMVNGENPYTYKILSCTIIITMKNTKKLDTSNFYNFRFVLFNGMFI